MEQDRQSTERTAIVGVVKKKKLFPWMRLSTRRTKLTLLFMITFSLVVVNALLLYRYSKNLYYVDQEQQVSEQEISYNQARDKIQGSYLATRGGQDIKVEYLALLSKGDADGALALYEKMAQSAESDAIRANVYRQLYSAAIVAQRYDHAVEGALGNAQIQAGIEEYEMVVKAYEYTGNKEGQIEYLRMIYSLIDPNVEGLSDMRKDTVSRLQALGVQL